MNPAIEKAKVWVSETGWPAITGWYRGSEIARHVVTFVVGMGLGAVFF